MPLLSIDVDTDLKLPAAPPPQDMEKEETPELPGEPKDVNPVSKEAKPPPKAGKWVKEEEKGTAPRLRLPRVLLRSPKKFSNGSPKKSNEKGSRPPKNSLKTSAGSRKEKTYWKASWNGLPAAPPPPTSPTSPQRSYTSRLRASERTS
uniref:Uncharacterized protein n=1 Tax=Peromyscus maniculatus bairdii TaxID=230844 RepID=A0A8C9CSC2_PERMB